MSPHPSSALAIVVLAALAGGFALGRGLAARRAPVEPAPAVEPPPAVDGHIPAGGVWAR